MTPSEMSEMESIVYRHERHTTPRPDDIRYLLERIQELEDAGGRLRNALNEDSQVFEIMCRRETERLLREEISVLREAMTETLRLTEIMMGRGPGAVEAYHTRGVGLPTKYSQLVDHARDIHRATATALDFAKTRLPEPGDSFPPESCRVGLQPQNTPRDGSRVRPDGDADA